MILPRLDLQPALETLPLLRLQMEMQLLTVSDTGYGAVADDFVTFSGAASLGGNITDVVLNQEYQIATIVNVNSYTIEAKDTSGDPVLAAAGDSGNGGGSTVWCLSVKCWLRCLCSWYWLGFKWMGRRSFWICYCFIFN
jgi:hypothetical protein